MKSEKLIESIDKIHINVDQTIYKIKLDEDSGKYIVEKVKIRSIDINIDGPHSYNFNHDISYYNRLITETIAHLGFTTFLTEKEANEIRDKYNRELEDKKKKEEKEREEKLKNIISNPELILEAANHCLSEECEDCPMDGLYKHDCDKRLLKLIKERIMK